MVHSRVRLVAWAVAQAKDAHGAPVRWWRQGLAYTLCGTAQPAVFAHTFAFNEPRG